MNATISYLHCSKMVDLEDHRQEDQGSQWVEQVEDLWTAKLQHLWDVAQPLDYTFQFDPGAGEYGLYGYQFETTKEQEKTLLSLAIIEEKEVKKPEPETPPSKYIMYYLALSQCSQLQTS